MWIGSLIVLAIAPIIKSDLFQHATQVASVASWMAIREDCPEYLWVDSTHLLFNTRDQFDGDRVRRSLWLFDSSSKGRKSLPSGSAYPYGRSVWEVEVSPDGKYLLDPIGCRVTDWAGHTVWEWERLRRMPRRDEFNSSLQDHVSWSYDGKSIIESVAEYDRFTETGVSYARPLGDVRHERPLSRLRFTRAPALNNPTETPDHRLMIVDVSNQRPRDPGTTIYSWLPNHPESLKLFKVTFPNSAEVSEDAISHDRKRIVWQTTAEPVRKGSWDDEDPKRGWPPTQPTYFQLWVSDSQGKHLQLLGSKRADLGHEAEFSQRFGYLKWVPGDKEISFMSSLFLYKLPIR